MEPSGVKVSFPKKVRAYDLEDLIGMGGMGQVFRATHELLDHKVALKRFAPARDDMDTPENRERFLREGKALATLHHQGIVGVHDLFEVRGQYWMVLDFVDGFTLERVLDKGPLPIDVACIVGLALAEALEHAHFHGILHRDIKASNVMISRDGVVKLMDFGIARDEKLDQVTRTGALVGTPMYLAPEIVKGKTASEESDIYALGALLYFAVSGRKLFAHATPENLFPLIAAGKFPGLAKVTRGLPRHLRHTIERCLHTKPEKRFGSVSELKRELEILLAEERVWVNHRERLVAYLSAHEFLTRQEAETWVDLELEWLMSKDPVQAERPGPSRWVLGAAAVGLVSIGTVAAYIVGADAERWRALVEALTGR